MAFMFMPGEGVESSMAARQFGLKPTWALGSAGAIAALPVIGGVECLTLLAEHDDASARAVETCATRWHTAGRDQRTESAYIFGAICPRDGKGASDAVVARLE